jgi:hypothetical protein
MQSTSVHRSRVATKIDYAPKCRLATYTETDKNLAYTIEPGIRRLREQSADFYI